MIMNEAKTQAENVKPTNFNIDVILDIMSQSQRDTLDVVLVLFRFFTTAAKRF